MTDQTTEHPTHTVAAQPGTRLEQMQAQYPALKAAADEAAALLKACTDAIKLELSQAAPEGSTRVHLAPAAGAPGLALTYAESWRIDSRKLKAEDPETYVRYAKKSGSWTLRVAQGGGE